MRAPSESRRQPVTGVAARRVPAISISKRPVLCADPHVAGDAGFEVVEDGLGLAGFGVLGLAAAGPAAFGSEVDDVALGRVAGLGRLPAHRHAVSRGRQLQCCHGAGRLARQLRLLGMLVCFGLVADAAVELRFSIVLVLFGGKGHIRLG